MKDALATVQILAAYHLTKSLRGAAERSGCSHHTVDWLVQARDAGVHPGPSPTGPGSSTRGCRRSRKWVEKSKGRILADVVRAKLMAMGYQGSDRSTRRAVSEVKEAYLRGNKRVHRPWTTEPGVWLQYDFGDGPLIDRVKTVLFVAWLAWPRFRIVIPLRDRTASSVFTALHRSFRLLGPARSSPRLQDSYGSRILRLRLRHGRQEMDQHPR
jgi:hypothetical protein